MRIACGHASFELNLNLLNPLSMRILIRIRVDRPLVTAFTILAEFHTYNNNKLCKWFS